MFTVGKGGEPMKQTRLLDLETETRARPQGFWPRPPATGVSREMFLGRELGEVGKGRQCEFIRT